MLQECSAGGAASGGCVWPGGGAAAGCYTPNNPSVDFSLEPQHPYSGDTAAVNRSHPGITHHYTTQIVTLPTLSSSFQFEINRTDSTEEAVLLTLEPGTDIGRYLHDDDC